MPPYNCVGVNDDQSSPPALPNSRDQDPEPTLATMQLRTFVLPFVNLQLLAQCNIFKSHRSMVAENQEKQPEKVKHRS